jgi:hypothetical protein
MLVRILKQELSYIASEATKWYCHFGRLLTISCENKHAGLAISVVECLPDSFEALGSIPSTTPTLQKKRKKMCSYHKILQSCSLLFVQSS